MTPADSTSFRIREAHQDDVAALARLHVATFKETHGGFRPPSYELRESQWRAAFDTEVGWFCYVAEDARGELVGFVKGQRHDGGVPGFDGELNKIYVLRRYHRHGLGRWLVAHAARRFLSEGMASMLLFGDAKSPSNGFYEHLGAERLLSAQGEFHGGYGWRDLHHLAASLPGESTGM